MGKFLLVGLIIDEIQRFAQISKIFSQTRNVGFLDIFILKKSWSKNHSWGVSSRIGWNVDKFVKQVGYNTQLDFQLPNFIFTPSGAWSKFKILEKLKNSAGGYRMAGNGEIWIWGLISVLGLILNISTDQVSPFLKYS